MKLGTFSKILTLSLFVSQLGLAADSNDPSANKVTIIVTQGGAASQVAKSNSKKPKKVKPTKKNTKPALAKAARTSVAVAPAAKSKVAAPRKVVAVNLMPAPAKQQQVPGRRASLANTDAARANGYTNIYSNYKKPDYTVAETQPAYNMNQTGLSAAPTLTTTVKKTPVKQSESHWEFQYKTDNAENMNSLMNYGTGLDYTIQAWDRVYLTYYINKDISVGAIAQYYHTWWQDQNRAQSPGPSGNPGLSQSYASYLGDTGFVFKDNKITTFAGGLELSGNLAYYAPTSESSQTAGMYGQTRSFLGLGRSFGPVDLKWNEGLWYDWQAYETNAYTTPSGKTLANAQYYIFSNIDFTYNFTKKFSFALETGFINEQNYGDSYNDLAATTNDYFELNPEFDYTFTKNLALSLGIWEVYNMTQQPTVNGQAVSYYTPFAPYNGTSPGSWTSSQLYLMGTVTF